MSTYRFLMLTFEPETLVLLFTSAWVSVSTSECVCWGWGEERGRGGRLPQDQEWLLWVPLLSASELLDQ